MGDATDLVFAEQLADRAVGERLAALRGKYQSRSITERTCLIQRGQRLARKRHAMLTSPFHAVSRDGPHVAVDLGPFGKARLAGPGSRQRQELKGQLRRRPRAAVSYDG